ncbi:diguanylate cyclase domain-containing protein [Shewanella cyperi]|uniref:diguanylate cyclase domain-containing protein n=1 Tax=Shewanella cyperi TaxID=2814292 RepID=UPI001A942ED8|nr:diguanylate cyclase [Shewanella cyperi]QSX40675.1 sensor domain-containing diguanylate cyclase [Shewanella cyperi]
MVAFVLVYIILAYSTVEYLQQSYLRDAEAERSRGLSQQLALIRANIEAEVNAEVFLADSLATLISFSPESTFEQWEQVAMQLTRKAEHIRNIGVAPNDVMAFVYPLQGNERVIGLDFRDYPNQWQTVQQARQAQHIIISGPLELVQGGTAIIARVPIFSDAPQNSQYWGTCSIVLDIDGLFRDAGVYDLPDNVSLAIRGRDGTGADGEVFFGEPGVFQDPLLSETVHLVSGSWQMGLSLKASSAAVPVSNWVKDNLPRVAGYTVALSLLLSFILVLNAYRLAHQISMQDVLTKLPNRRHAMLILEQLSQQGTASRFSIINIDLNRFKQVNDTYGHAVGDALLVEVARRMRHTLRGSDTVARLGGDEFLLILPRVCTREQQDRVKAKLLGEVCSQPFDYQGVHLDISLSLGVACFPEHGNAISELLHHADQAMYQDKQQRKLSAVQA